MSRRAASPSPQKRIWRSRLTGQTSCRFSSSGRRLQQIPFSAPGIDKDRYQPIGLATRLFQEIDPAPEQILVIPPEIVGVEKKSDPSADLIADTGPLTLVARNREHQRRASALRRGDDNPALGRRKGGVFENRETKDAAEKGKPIVTVRHKNRDSGETPEHGALIGSYGPATGRYRSRPRPGSSRRPPIEGRSVEAAPRGRRRGPRARSPQA